MEASLSGAAATFGKRKPLVSALVRKALRRTESKASDSSLSSSACFLTMNASRSWPEALTAFPARFPVSERIQADYGPDTKSRGGRSGFW